MRFRISRACSPAAAVRLGVRVGVFRITSSCMQSRAGGETVEYSTVKCHVQYNAMQCRYGMGTRKQRKNSKQQEQ
jgi:hypothetical protein